MTWSDMVVLPMQATLVTETHQHEIGVSMLWSSENPAAVTLMFCGDTENRWTFARELLDGGGMGDVHVTRGEGRITVSLTGVDQGQVITATLLLPLCMVDIFLERARAKCPDEAISYTDGLDAFLASLDGSC